MKKKWLLGILGGLCIAACAIGFSACNNTGEPGNPGISGLKYTLDSNGEFYSVRMGSCTDENVVIPSTHNDLPVKVIDGRGFKNKDGLKSVVIPDSVTSIGEDAFSSCDSLTSIEVNGNNTAYKSIDGNLYTKDGKTLVQYAIGKTATAFIVPDSVTSIGSYAFNGCSSLTSVTINGGSIGSYAFHACTSLTSVTIGDSETSIGNTAFGYCLGLTSVTIGGSVTSIGEEAFAACYNLTSVVIGDSVTSIGKYAFKNCTSLTSVTIGGSVTSIGYHAFSWGTSLTSIEVDENNTAYKSIDGNLYTKDGKTLLQYAIGKMATTFIVPDGVTSIGMYAFEHCYSLTKIVIPDSVTSIGNWAFEYCDSLTEIVIPDSVMSIGSPVFKYCDSLTIYCEAESRPSGWASNWNSNRPVVWDCNNNDVASDGYIYTVVEGIRYALKNGEAMVAGQPSNITTANISASITYKGTSYPVTSIGSSAFYYCESLTKVVIPDSVTSIGNYAFEDCYSLTIYCEATSEPSGWFSYWNYSNRPVVWGYTGN